MLYYNSKMIFWKSVMIVAKPKDNNKYFSDDDKSNDGRK